MQECHISPFNLLKPILSSDIVNVIIRLLCVQATENQDNFLQLPKFPGQITGNPCNLHHACMETTNCRNSFIIINVQPEFRL